MNIVEFLEARIAEDERKAEAGGYHNGSGVFANDNYGCLLVQPARVLAECAAKRAIIEAFDPKAPDLDPYVGVSVIAMLATVYKDHPDYREDWSDAI